MDHNLPIEAGQTFIFADSVYARHWKVQMRLDLWTQDYYTNVPLVTELICLRIELLGCLTFGRFTVNRLNVGVTQVYSYLYITYFFLYNMPC